MSTADTAGTADNERTAGPRSRKGIRTRARLLDAAKLVFKDAPAMRVGEAGAGMEILEQVLDRAAILLSFEQCGGADRCLELAKAYAMERYAFGRVIASYQAIKHKLADMYVKNELARSNAYYGAWALNTNAAETPLAASAARMLLSASIRKVALVTTRSPGLRPSSTCTQPGTCAPSFTGRGS